MIKTGIVVKMTIVTFLFFMFFIGGAFLFEGTFFESFYLEQKIELISESIDDFAKQYSYTSWDSQELKDNITLFNNENGVELTVLDRYGNIKDEQVYQIVIETSDGEIFKLHLNHLLNESSDNLLNLKYGDKINTYGFKWIGSHEVFKPLVIIHDDEEMISLVLENDRFDLDYIEGTVIGQKLPRYSDIKSAIYKQPIREFVLDFMIDNGNRYSYLANSGVYEKAKEEEVYNQMVFYRPLGKSTDREMIFVLESQRHIVEAKDILSDYNFYILVFSFILIIFLSYFYSMTLLNPLLKINKIAERMAKLDFSEKINVKRSDEIGSLSNSLNTLSTNLSNNMEELTTANKQLKVEIEKERKLENLRKEFVSGVSHELKTPLGIIRGFAEGIKDDIFEDSTYYLDVIIEETEKMDALVVDMLELSKLESVNFKINKQYFDLYELIEFVINKFKYNLKEKNLSIKFNKYSDSAICFGDEIRIEQVLVNYMSNAVRHSDRNEEITLSVSKKKGIIKFRIENIGDKIPENKIGKVWNRFYRVDEARNKSDGGTGLGLAIVRNIIELHECKFGVKNTKKGVSFYFTIKTTED